jgi:hypothetical protein
LTLLPVFALTLLLLVFFNKGAFFVSAVSALLVLLSSLSLSWVFIGWDQPMKILMSEILPRSIGTLLGIISIWLSESLYLYFAIQGFFLFYSISKSLSLCAISWTKLLKRKVTFAEYIFFVKGEFNSTSVTVYSTIAVSLPSLLLSQVNILAFTYFSICEKLMRLFHLVANPSLYMFQSSLKSQNTFKSHRARIVGSIKYFSILGFGAAFMTISLGGWASRVISDGIISLQISALVPIAVSFLMMSLSRAVGIVGLISFDEVKTVADSALYGLLILVPPLVILTMQFSYIGSLWSLTLMHIFILGFQTLKIIPFLNPLRFQDKPRITRTIEQ